MRDEPDGYQVYLLRLWRAQSRGKQAWRVSTESPGTGERQSFASLEQFYAFLSARCERQAPDSTITQSSAEGS